MQRLIPLRRELLFVRACFGFLLLDDFGSCCSSRGSGFRSYCRLCNDEDCEVGIDIGFHAFWKREITDVNGVADFEGADIDLDDLGKILREALNGNRAHALLEEAAKVFHAVRFAERLDGDVGRNFFCHRHCLEIHMQNLVAERVALHFLDERELAGFVRAVLDFQIDEDVFSNGVGEEDFQFAVRDFEICRRRVVTVDDGWDGSAGANALDGIAAAFGAGTGCEFNLLGHMCGLLGLFYFKERTYGLVVVNAPDPLTEKLGNGE